MIEARAVATVLGGKTLLHRDISSLDDLIDIMGQGLPKDAAIRVADCLPALRARLLDYIAPRATLKRRTERLKPDESERTERLARIIATARHVWGDDELAQAFLTAPHAMLHGKPPIEAAFTALGARQVEELLWDIYYGFPA